MLESALMLPPSMATVLLSLGLLVVIAYLFGYVGLLRDLPRNRTFSGEKRAH